MLQDNSNAVLFPPREYLNVPEVAKTLGISVRKTWELIHGKSDPLPYYRIGPKIVRVRACELHAWMIRRRESASKVDLLVNEILEGAAAKRTARRCS
ncbi:MAG: helix-turn-helix transcriptional regulator [Syntrophobacteraceae bacterium]